MTSRRLWPLLVSIFGHGLALAALVYFAVGALPAPGEGRGRNTAVVPVESPPAASVADVEPVSEVEYAPDAVLPDVPPPQRVEEPPPAVPALPPLRPTSTEPPPWRVDQIPLEVARRRVRPEPASAPPLPEQRRGEEQPRLDPIHTPRYWPREAWEQGLRGHVLVLITVGTSGTVLDAVLLVSSGHTILDEAALASARQWRFGPLARSVRAKLPFSFGKRRVR